MTMPREGEWWRLLLVIVGTIVCCDSADDGTCGGQYYSRPLCVNQPDGYVCRCGPGYDWNTHICISTAVDSAFQFTRAAYSSLSISRQAGVQATTVAAWLNVDKEGDHMPIIAYARAEGQDLETVMSIAIQGGSISLSILGQTVHTGVEIAQSKWEHLVVTWASKDGRWAVFINSKRKNSGHLNEVKRALPGRGRFILGRYSMVAPNTVESQESPADEKRFNGRMAHVHVWARVLNKTAISKLYNDCLFITCGDMAQWTEFREGTRGQMKMKWPSGVFQKKCFDIPEAANSCDRYCSLVIGAQCNEEVVENILWARTPAEHTISVPCPGSVVDPGRATSFANRSCSKNDLDGLWSEPNVDDCISSPIHELKQEIDYINTQGRDYSDLHSQLLELTRRLRNYTRDAYIHTPIDISAITKILASLIRIQGSNVVDESWVKDFERYARTKQEYPTYNQIAAFSKTFISIIDNMLNPRNGNSWAQVKPQGLEGDEFLQVVEQFLGMVSRTLLHHVTSGTISHNQAFIKVKRKYFALKIVSLPSTSMIGVAFPDNEDEVNLRMAHSHGTVAMPKEALADAINTFIPEYLVVAAVRLKVLSDVLPNHNLTAHSKDDNVNSLLFGAYVYLDNGREITNLSAPVRIHLPYKNTFNISNPECVSLTHGNGTGAWRWTDEFCYLTDAQPKFATCACNKAGLFTITTDMYDDNWDKGEEPNVLMEIPSYIGCATSIMLCLFSLTMLVYLRTSSNTAAIHKNFSSAVILAQLSFMFGIDRIQYQIVCHVFAISLHYFVLAAFSWLMNEAFNLYIVITYAAHSHGEHTESSMWRYYILGWILPGVLVGAFVGTNNSDYYAPDMCWIAWEHIWLFAGPIVGIISIIILVLTFTAKEHHESSYTKNEKANKIILIHTKALWTQVILLTIMWTFAFISILMRGIIVKCLFALFDVLQGAFFLVFYFLLNDEVRTMYKAHRKKKSLALQGYDFAGGGNDSDSESEDESLFADQGVRLSVPRGSVTRTGGNGTWTKADPPRKRSEIEASSEGSDCEMVTSL